MSSIIISIFFHSMLISHPDKGWLQTRLTGLCSAKYRCIGTEPIISKTTFWSDARRLSLMR